ncbi:MAG: HAD family hydrolase [Thioalkalivibrionaceae bacterium]
MKLALFDLDNTLLAGDSDHAWGQFLCDVGAVDSERFRAEHDRFYADYCAGTLDIRAFCRMAFEPLARHDPAKLAAWHAQFMQERIEPMIAPAAAALLEHHRARGEQLVIITATNRFVTAPIAALLDIEHLIATDPEVIDGRYTGELAGIPCFQQGKIARLEIWCGEHGLDPKQTRAAIAGATFYSDSRNDLPLLERVATPVAVDPDERLKEVAGERGWSCLTLRAGPTPAPCPGASSPQRPA